MILSDDFSVYHTESMDMNEETKIVRGLSCVDMTFFARVGFSV